MAGGVRVIPARKSAAFARWFSGDAERRMRRAFHAVRARGIETIRGALATGPVLVVTNHTAWWDPLVAIVTSMRVLDADAYSMMDARNLERLPFFAKVGAFGVDLSDPRDGARAIRHAAKLLSGPQRLVWIFAQGREVPITVRPLGFRAGSGEIARVSRAVVVPGALRYEMGATPEPTAWISFGAPIDPIRDVDAAREEHERRVGDELDRIDRAIARGEADGFEPLHEKRPSALFALAQGALAWATRPRLT
jgi:1-acyl-sn-glycerol-3-phosphate acyltransferase